ncbi:PREDICTED: UPF0481 protein At3g47200 isoform X1 [Camelina sativa]|uniref:UPF0481 protein At3g47200 isoform X1 n=1 Tax=Camelina sativa TaxID=90675 RepID=A0ABM1QNI7_CAMSA|nr:PREDICTED: UPF0481 protein At3g47200 isoform X1 [Camelina sativa]
MDKNEGDDALVDSIKAKLDSLSSLTTHCCIYKVPNKLRILNPDAYTPRLVSFGPLHHGKEELQAMEEHKYRFRITSSSLQAYLNKDRIFGNSVMITDVCRDMMLIENQFPFFVVKEIFLLLFVYYQQGTPSILKLAQRHFSCFLSNIDDEMLTSEPKHFVDLLRSCYLPLVPARLKETTLKVENAPEATELHTVGVNFKPAEASCLLDISFSDGVLKIPTIFIDDLTESLYRNIIAFEQCHCSDKNFLHYIRLLGCLIKSPTDANLLIRSGIIMNNLGNAEDVSKLFHSIYKEVIFGRRFYFQTISENLQAYCNTPWNRWKAILRHDFFYFHSPWSVVSVFAVILLIILTFIQVVCSILAL